jgi:hypothetical protein
MRVELSTGSRLDPIFKANHQVGCDLLVDIQDIFNLYFDNGNHVEYHNAIIASNPIHPKTFHRANQPADHITNNLSNILSCMHTVEYGNLPRCASFSTKIPNNNNNRAPTTPNKPKQLPAPNSGTKPGGRGNPTSESRIC